MPAKYDWLKALLDGPSTRAAIGRAIGLPSEMPGEDVTIAMEKLYVVVVQARPRAEGGSIYAITAAGRARLLARLSTRR
jgi:hypothetical protein